MECVEVREMLPAFVDDVDASLSARHHLSNCPGCRAELDRYRQLQSAVVSLREVTADVPAGLRDSLVAIPTSSGAIQQVRTHLTRNRTAYAGGLAVAALGAVGAYAWRSRSRRLATA